ncbi:FAD-dependent oxidoreductase [Labrys neptuniae]
MSEPGIVIVGAGPAGMRAAITLVEAGHRPVVIDEAMRSGGQVYRRPPAVFSRSARALYGFEADRATALHGAFDAIIDRIDYRPETLIWSAEGRMLHLLHEGRADRLPWSRLILATGAMDRIIPVAGWTLPGAYTLGAAQIALKAQALGVGRTVTFFGTGPLLYLVAYQYAKAGLTVRGVFDVAPHRQAMGALVGLARGGRTFLKGLYYMAWLRAHGVPVLAGITPLSIEAGRDGAVAGLRIRAASGHERHIPCDGVGFGYGLKSETQLADLLGLDFSYDEDRRQWLPGEDENGRGSLPGVYLAGDGAGVMGADAADLRGRRAALTTRFDLGETNLREEITRLNTRLSEMQPFRHALDHIAFPFPDAMARAVPDDVMVCRCEGLTAGAIRKAARDTGEADINRIKAFTRLGMGRCQGRVCGVTAAAILADTATTASPAGRVRGQAPIKPIPMRAFLEAADDIL